MYYISSLLWIPKDSRVLPLSVRYASLAFRPRQACPCSKSYYIRFSARTNCSRKNTTEIFKRWQVSPIKPHFNIFCQNTGSLIPSKHYWSRSRGLLPQDRRPVFPDPAQFLALDPWSHIARYVTLRDAFFVNLDMFDQTLSLCLRSL